MIDDVCSVIDDVCSVIDDVCSVQCAYVNILYLQTLLQLDPEEEAARRFNEAHKSAAVLVNAVAQRLQPLLVLGALDGQVLLPRPGADELAEGVLKHD